MSFLKVLHTEYYKESQWNKLIISLLLLLTHTACTLKTLDQSPVIRLQFSKKASRELSRQLSRTLSRHRSLLPSSASSELQFAMSDFNCFGIQVSGAGIIADSRLDCSTTTGMIGGLVPSAGGEIELQVPPGTARKVQVFAIRSAVGCPSWDELLAKPSDTRFNGIDKPYEIGSTTIDIFNDVTVTVQSNFDPTSPVEVFPSCSVGQSGYGLPDLNPSGPAVFAGGITEGTAATCHSNSGRPCLKARFALDTHSLSGGIAAAPTSPTTTQKYNLQFNLISTEPEKY